MRHSLTRALTLRSLPRVGAAGVSKGEGMYSEFAAILRGPRSARAPQDEVRKTQYSELYFVRLSFSSFSSTSGS
jgi:hypothetical protein